MKIFLRTFFPSSICGLVLLLLELIMTENLLCTIVAEHSLMTHLEMVTPSNQRYYLNKNAKFDRPSLCNVHNQGYFLIFVDNFITFFFSDLISGHQLSLEQVAGCHKAICQNSDNCTIVIMEVSFYTEK